VCVAHLCAHRPPASWYRRLNWLGVLLTPDGPAPRSAVTLQMRGRASGKLRRMPILRTPFHGKDYLVARAGESHWVRNARAARSGAVIRRGRARHVRLQELAPADRPDIIAEYLRAGRRRSGADANANRARFCFGLGRTLPSTISGQSSTTTPCSEASTKLDQLTIGDGQRSQPREAMIRRCSARRLVAPTCERPTVGQYGQAAARAGALGGSKVLMAMYPTALGPSSGAGQAKDGRLPGGAGNVTHD